MPFIPYQASKFPSTAGSLLHGKQKLNASWAEIVGSAMTVGKPDASYLLKHGWHSFSDLIVRAHTIWANLVDHGGLVHRSRLYEAQDPTEKGGTSYFVGMTSAKLMAARLLGVPWLFHFSMTGPLHIPIRKRGSLHPDMLGETAAGDWVVVEAKGRSNGFSQAALKKAKDQASVVGKINSRVPLYRIAVQSYFSPLGMRLVDPPSEEGESDPPPRKGEPRNIAVDATAARRRYYGPIFNATRDSKSVRSVEGHEFICRSLGEIGVTVGIEASLKEGLANQKEAQPQKVFGGVRTGAGGGGYATFEDGTAVFLDERWGPNEMSKDPMQRLSDG